MRHVCGLDVHKDSVLVCILNEKGVVFQEKFGVLTPELERMVGVIMEHGVTEVGDGEHERVLDAGVEGDRPLCGAEAGEPILHPPASGKEERREGRRVDSDVHPQRPGARQLCPGGTHPAAPPVRQAHLQSQRRHRPQAD